jgi:ATP-binding cassette subfamily B multidrug efflux pump
VSIPAGQKVGLVGPSGAGKSTFVQLVLRLYDLQGGRIRIDGQDIAAVGQDSLREQVALIPQSADLLHRSLFENIAYGRPEADEAAVRAAAARARALDFIEDLTDAQGRRGLAAHVGERGVKLSGGQRQRIAIARAILKDAPILILDEATAALDSQSERAIQAALQDVMAGRTVIAIAHRLSTIAHLDRLLVMEDGRLIEEGRHDALLAQGGLYAHLWSLQSGDQLVA